MESLIDFVQCDKPGVIDLLKLVQLGILNKTICMKIVC